MALKGSVSFAVDDLEMDSLGSRKTSLTALGEEEYEWESGPSHARYVVC